MSFRNKQTTRLWTTHPASSCTGHSVCPPGPLLLRSLGHLGSLDLLQPALYLGFNSLQDCSYFTSFLLFEQLSHFRYLLCFWYFASPLPGISEDAGRNRRVCPCVHTHACSCFLTFGLPGCWLSLKSVLSFAIFRRMYLSSGWKSPLLLSGWPVLLLQPPLPPLMPQDSVPPAAVLALWWVTLY